MAKISQAIANGVKAAATVIYLRRIEFAPNPEEKRTIEQMQRDSLPVNAAHTGVIDDIIDPREVCK